MTVDLDLDLDLGGGLRMRVLVAGDAALLAEATSGESEPALWGPRPAGPYSVRDAEAALAAWDPANEAQFSLGILHEERLAGAVGLMPDRPGSIEVAYWIRPERRGQGIASRAVRAATHWAHQSLAVPRIWLEIRPGNEASLRVAQRAGFTFEQRLALHCREWSTEDAEHDTWHDCLIWTYSGTTAPYGTLTSARRWGPPLPYRENHGGQPSTVPANELVGDSHARCALARAGGHLRGSRARRAGAVRPDHGVPGPGRAI